MKTLVDSLSQVFKLYKCFGFRVNTCFADGEFECLRDEVEGVHFAGFPLDNDAYAESRPHGLVAEVHDERQLRGDHGAMVPPRAHECAATGPLPQTKLIQIFTHIRSVFNDVHPS